MATGYCLPANRLIPVQFAKMQKESISLNLRRDAEPVLCLTKYANYTHLNKPELYIAESGAKTKAMTAGLEYAKSCTSKDFNQEVRKNREEQSIKTEKLKKRGYEGLSY